MWLDAGTYTGESGRILGQKPSSAGWAREFFWAVFPRMPKWRKLSGKEGGRRTKSASAMMGKDGGEESAGVRYLRPADSKKRSPIRRRRVLDFYKRSECLEQ